MESLQENNNFQNSLKKVSTTDAELQCIYCTQLSDPDSQKLYLESLRHDVLGMLKLPLIGKYSNYEYEFARNVSLVTLLLRSPNSVGNYISLTDGVVNSNLCVNLPLRVKDLLTKIPNPISDNNREANSNGNPAKSTNENKATSMFEKNQGSQSNSAKQSKEELNMEADLNEMKKEQNKGYFTSDTFEFHWIISLNEFTSQKNTGNNQAYRTAKEDSKELILNYVLHPFLFPNLDFSKKKRQFLLTPITLWPSDGYREDIEEFREGERSKAKRYNGIKFNNLRMEYSSIHMKGQSLCFSPNNLKFTIKPDSAIISDFWTIVLGGAGSKHKVFYHWLINSKDVHEIIESICVNTSNLNQFIFELEAVFGTDNPAMKMSRNIFEFASTAL